MRVIGFLALLLILVMNQAVLADTIETKEGTFYQGSILFHNDNQYWISVDGKVERIKISDISKINFGDQ